MGARYVVGGGLVSGGPYAGRYSNNWDFALHMLHVSNGTFYKQFTWGHPDLNDQVNDFHIDESTELAIVGGMMHWRYIDYLCGVH